MAKRRAHAARPRPAGDAAAAPLPAPASRHAFADLLRAVAALSVLYYHLGQFFWHHHNYAAAIAGFQPDPALLRELRPLEPTGFGFDLGAFGVALFFLVSGYVIPGAVARYGPAGFLVARFFRIWPTWAACLALSLVVLGISLALSGQAWPYSAGRVVANLLLVRDLVGERLVDPVVWTLEIEVKYYLLATLIAVAARRTRLAPLRLHTAAAALLLAGILGNAVFGSGDPARQQTVAVTLGSVGFILLGTAIHALQDRISPEAALLALMALASGVLAGWLLPTPTAAFTNFISYAIALIVFMLAAAWPHWKRWLPAGGHGGRRFAGGIGWIAERSYPLYAVHTIPGFAMLAVGWHWTGSVVLAGVMATGACLFLASAIHGLVEHPTRGWGRTLAMTVGNNGERRRAAT